MGGLSSLNAARVTSDSGLLHTPDSIANLEQEPTVMELFDQAGVIGEYGGLGFLFGEPAWASVPTPLETPGTPGISAQLLARMQSAGELTNTYAYQERPDQFVGGPVRNVQEGASLHPAEVAAPPSGQWTFTDTIRSEVSKLQDRISRFLNRGTSG